MGWIGSLTDVRDLLYYKANIVYELRRDYREVASHVKEALAYSPDTTSPALAAYKIKER